MSDEVNVSHSPSVPSHQIFEFESRNVEFPRRQFREWHRFLFTSLLFPLFIRILQLIPTILGGYVVLHWFRFGDSRVTPRYWKTYITSWRSANVVLVLFQFCRTFFSAPTQTTALCDHSSVIFKTDDDQKLVSKAVKIPSLKISFFLVHVFFPVLQIRLGGSHPHRAFPSLHLPAVHQGRNSCECWHGTPRQCVHRGWDHKSCGPRLEGMQKNRNCILIDSG